ncbi:MAG: hypothetical protein FWC57_02225 [Endomicrobia bacterium]|nr:hypothetical protein [Endomicrobiia bacterium]
MKKLFAVVFILSVVCGFAYSQQGNGGNSQDQTDMQKQQEMLSQAQTQMKSMIAGLKNMMKDMTPEQKAEFKKNMDDIFKKQAALFETTYKKDAKNMSEQDKKDFEKGKKMMDEYYKQVMQELGLN